MRNTKEGRTPFPRSLKSNSKRHRVCSRKHLMEIRPNSSGKDYQQTSKNLSLSLSLTIFVFRYKHTLKLFHTFLLKYSRGYFTEVVDDTNNEKGTMCWEFKSIHNFRNEIGRWRITYSLQS